MSALREIADPFAGAPRAGARVRTRLRGCGDDAAVLREVGGYLGSLASADLAARCAEGSLDAEQRARSRQVRKQELTAKSSSRWAGALTRTSEDAYQLACRGSRPGWPCRRGSGPGGCAATLLQLSGTPRPSASRRSVPGWPRLNSSWSPGG